MPRPTLQPSPPGDHETIPMSLGEPQSLQSASCGLSFADVNGSPRGQTHAAPSATAQPELRGEYSGVGLCRRVGLGHLLISATAVRYGALVMIRDAISYGKETHPGVYGEPRPSFIGKS